MRRKSAARGAATTDFEKAWANKKMADISREQKTLIKDSSLLAVSGLLTGFFYSLVHLVLIRKMDGISYAMFASLMALLKVMNVPSMALMTSIARYTSKYVHENEAELWVTIVKRALRRLIILGVAALAAWCLLSGIIKDVMHVPSRLNIIMLGIVAFLGLFTPVVQGTLQGARRFGWMAGSGVANAFSRAVFCIIALVVFGSQVSPMLAAVAGGALVGLSVGYIPFRSVVSSVKAIEGYDTKPVYNYFWPVLIGQGAVFFLSELDLILAPKFLVGDELSAYSKAAMLTRCIFLLTQPLAVAIFPRAVVGKKKWMVLGSVGFSFAVSVVMASFVYFFTGIPVKILGLTESPVYGELLRIYIWAALPFSMLSIMTPYLWARNKLMQVMWLVPVAVVYALLRMRYSGSPEQMIACLAGVLWLAVLVLGVSMINELRRE